MPLQRNTLDVPLATMQQQLPATAPPVGRLSRIVNSVARKFKRGDVTTLRTEKRAGFAQLPIVIRDPDTGAVSAKDFQDTSLISALGDRLVAVAGNTPRVLSDANADWLAPTVTTPTRVLREREIYNGGLSVITPDSARVGSRTMYTGIGGTTAIPFQLMIVDDDGTVVLNPFAINFNATQVKVTADATRFWLVVFDSIAVAFVAYAIDTNGVVLGSASVARNAGAAYYDITPANGGNGVLLAQRAAGAGVKFTVFTFAAGVVTPSSATTAAMLASSGRLAWLRNDSGDGNYYLATVDGAGPFDYYAWQVSGAGLGSLHQYTVAAAQAVAPIEITGFRQQQGVADIVVAYSFLDVIPDLRRNFSTIFTVTFAGVSTLQRTQRSLTLVSRTFKLNNINTGDPTYYVIMYYQPESPSSNFATQQATYFMVELKAPWKVVGTFEQGIAFADWQNAGDTVHWMQLSSVRVDAADGVRVALAYRATSFTRRVNTTGTGGFDVGAWWDVLANTVGIREYTWGADHGQAVELSEALLMPGPQAVSFDGTSFTEAGITLSAEWPLINALVQSAGGGTKLALLGTYQYVLVDEWTDATGNRVRGPASPPFPASPAAGFVLTGANNQFTVTGLSTHVSSKQNLTHAVYRTIMVNGVQSTAHYKVTDDLNPIINDDTTATWSFVDTMPDNVAAVNEKLYTDNGALDHFPPPPFSVGCEAKGRAFVIGPDHAVWFSGEKTEGDDYWFSPLFRIPVLTNEKLTQVKALDNYLIIFTERTSAYVIPISQLPDATGAGPIPRAEKMPFTSGCTGHAATIESGIAYSSAQGGIWLITRSLSNVFIGADVQDETNVGAVRGMVVDKNQKLYVLAAESLLVFDEIVGAWFVWSPFAMPALLGMHKGQLSYVAQVGGGISATVWRQAPGTFSDVDITPTSHAIAQRLQILKVLLGGVRGFRRVWNIQIEGEYVGAHSLAVAITFYPDDRNAPSTRSYPVVPIAGQPYVFEFPPTIEQVSGVALDILETAVIDSGGFTLEMLGFEVGIEKGLGRLPTARRIVAT